MALITTAIDPVIGLPHTDRLQTTEVQAIQL